MISYIVVESIGFGSYIATNIEIVPLLIIVELGSL